LSLLIFNYGLMVGHQLDTRGCLFSWYTFRVFSFLFLISAELNINYIELAALSLSAWQQGSVVTLWFLSVIPGSYILLGPPLLKLMN